MYISIAIIESTNLFYVHEEFHFQTKNDTCNCKKNICSFAVDEREIQRKVKWLRIEREPQE